MNKIIFILLSILVFGCSTKAPIKQTVFKGSETSLSSLSTDDRSIFDANWATAETLLEQDKMAWIATDSILAKMTSKEKKSLKGYIVVGNLLNGEVLFFTQNNKDITFIKKATFNNGNYVRNDLDSITATTRLLLIAECVQKSKQINMDYIIKQKVNYNTYSIDNGKEIVVYLAPGSDDDAFVFGGGVMTKFDNAVNVVQNKVLHKSIIYYPAKNIGDILVRSSSLSNVINEIDILQYLVFKNTIYNHMIRTKNYTFSLYFVPEENRIIKSVMINK